MKQRGKRNKIKKSSFSRKQAQGKIDMKARKGRGGKKMPNKTKNVQKDDRRKPLVKKQKQVDPNKLTHKE